METPKIGTVAYKIKAQLDQQSRSVKWLSDETGTPYTTLVRKLRGHSDVGTAELIRYANALKVHPSEIAPDELVAQR